MDDLKRSAIIFSPHQDDETLACGGTIIKKKRAGADVRIVFMTDSSKSHSDFIPGNEMRAIRKSEGLSASQILGLDQCNVSFLDFEVRQLRNQMGTAIDRVTEIILQQQPEEIFIPYYRESHSDHFSTNRIVLSALKNCKRKVKIYEYPVWFWLFWPWAIVTMRNYQGFISAFTNSLASGFRFLKDFKCSVYIGDVLDLKGIALDQYKSQMTRLIPDLRWPILGDVADGEFLKCFFQEHEIFFRYSLHENRIRRCKKRDG